MSETLVPFSRQERVKHLNLLTPYLICDGEMVALARGPGCSAPAVPIGPAMRSAQGVALRWRSAFGQRCGRTLPFSPAAARRYRLRRSFTLLRPFQVRRASRRSVAWWRRKAASLGRFCFAKSRDVFSQTMAPG